jgi:hypothetical protein
MFVVLILVRGWLAVIWRSLSHFALMLTPTPAIVPPPHIIRCLRYPIRCLPCITSQTGSDRLITSNLPRRAYCDALRSKLYQPCCCPHRPPLPFAFSPALAQTSPDRKAEADRLLDQDVQQSKPASMKRQSNPGSRHSPFTAPSQTATAKPMR